MTDKIYKDRNGDYRVKPKSKIVDDRGKIIHAGEKVTVIEQPKTEGDNGDK